MNAAVVKEWFQTLTRREQSLIVIMLALCAAIGAFYGLVRPATNYAARLDADLKAAEVEYNLLQAQLAELENLEHLQTQNSELKLPTGARRPWLAEQAAAIGVRIERIEPEGKALHVWTADVSSPLLFTWLQRLSSARINVQSAHLEATGTKGTIRARLILTGATDG